MAIKFLTWSFMFLFAVVFCAGARAYADQQNPDDFTYWTDFPLGSWAVYDVVERTDGEEDVVERIRNRTVEFMAGGMIFLENSFWLDHRWGNVSKTMEGFNEIPEELELLSEEPGKFTIGETAYETVVRTWQEVYETDYRPGFSRTITIAASYVDEPIALRRLIDYGNGEFIISPNCVGIEITVVEMDVERPPMRRKISSDIVQLDKEVEIDGALLSVIVEEGSVLVVVGDEQKEHLLQSRRLLSRDVPGFVVREEQRGKDEEGLEHGSERTLVAFRVADPIHEIDFRNLPSRSDRPVIPGDDWAGMRLGAWRLRIYVNADDMHDSPNMKLERVIAIDEDDFSYVVSSTNMAGGTVGEKSLELVNLAEREGFPVGEPEIKKEHEIITLAGVEIPCEVVIERIESASDAKVERISWMPVEEEHRRLASAFPGGAIRRKSITTVPYQGRNVQIIDANQIMNRLDDMVVGGRKIKAAMNRNTSFAGFWEGESEEVKLELVSSEIPGGVFASVDFRYGNEPQSYSVIPAWGEAERAVPDDIDGRALEITSRIKGFSAHYHPWYGWKPGASALRLRTEEDSEGGRSVDIRLFKVVKTDWFGVPTVMRQNIYMDDEVGTASSFVMPQPERWEIGVDLISVEPATFEIDGAEIDCVKETWSGTDEESGRTTTIELLRAPGPVAPARTTAMFGREVGIDPDILSFIVRAEARNQLYTSEMRLTAIGEEVEVGSEIVTCVREVGEMSFKAGVVSRGERFERLLSSQVPGLVVTSETTTFQPPGQKKVEVRTLGFDVPKPAHMGDRVMMLAPGWGGTGRGAFARYRAESRKGADSDVEAYEFDWRVEEIYERDTGVLLRNGTQFEQSGTSDRIHISPHLELMELGLDLRRSATETITALGREIETTREEWVTPEGDRHITLWKSDEIELFDREVVLLNFAFTLESDVVRLMARRTGSNQITILRRIESVDVPVTVGNMELVGIEEVERWNIPGRDSGVTIRTILSPWVPGSIVNTRTMWRDDDELQYTDIQLIEFDWGDGE